MNLILLFLEKVVKNDVCKKLKTTVFEGPIKFCFDFVNLATCFTIFSVKMVPTPQPSQQNCVCVRRSVETFCSYVLFEPPPPVRAFCLSPPPLFVCFVRPPSPGYWGTGKLDRLSFCGCLHFLVCPYFWCCLI